METDGNDTCCSDKGRCLRAPERTHAAKPCSVEAPTAASVRVNLNGALKGLCRSSFGWGGGGERGFGTQKFVHQKWPNKIFQNCKFRFPPRRSLRSGGGGGVEPPVWHSVRLLFLYGAPDSHPFFPSHVASGRCVEHPHPPFGL